MQNYVIFSFILFVVEPPSGEISNLRSSTKKATLSFTLKLTKPLLTGKIYIHELCIQIYNIYIYAVMIAKSIQNFLFLREAAKKVLFLVAWPLRGALPLRKRTFKALFKLF